MRRARIRKTIKWGGLFVTVLMVAVCVASVWWSGGWCLTSRHRDAFAVRGGALFIVSDENLAAGIDAQCNTVFRYSYPYQWRFDWGFGAGSWAVFIPLWAPILVSALITAAAWRSDLLARRRARTGHCLKCNYNRVGIAPDAPCPECGTKPATS